MERGKKTARLNKTAATLSVIMLLFHASHSMANPFSGFVIYDSSYAMLPDEEAYSGRGLVGLAFEQSLSNNWSYHIGGQMLRGKNGNQDTLDLQVYSNIDEAEFTKLYEAWLQGSFLQDKVRVKLGQMDANSEFAFVDNGAEFINSSFGFSPTISFLPTYPAPAVGAVTEWRLPSGDAIVAGAFMDEDNTANNPFYISEYRLALTKTNIKLGGWYKDQSVPSLRSPITQNSTQGYYAIAEGEMESSFKENSKAIAWFVQLGYSDQEYNVVKTHYSLGAMYPLGLIHNNDKLGVAITGIETSQYLSDSLKKTETAFELFYKLIVHQHLAIKPDIQYIDSPAGQMDAENAVVVTLRLEATW